ncbi:MAG: phosphatidate cytidylyltransferase [Saccharofermentanales bacterium]
MKRRVITGIVFTLIVAGFLVPGFAVPQLPLFFFFVVAVICIIEITTVLRNKLPDISQAATVAGSIGVFIPIIPVLVHGDLKWRFIQDFHVTSPNKLLIERVALLDYVTESVNYLVLFMIVFTFISVIFILTSRGPMKLLEALVTPLTVMYIVTPLFCAVMLLYIFPNGYLWMLASVIAAWITDLFAYFAGVTLGKHKIVPLISPKKTWEGTIGGVLGSIFIMTLWMSVFMHGPDIIERSAVYLISFGVVLGLLGSIAAQLGDWFASTIKRRSGVKDFGNVLPGHGGILDRFDAVFFTMPTMVIAALIYYFL